MNEVRTRDYEIIGDAIHDALGPRQTALILLYLGYGDENDDGGTGWMKPDEFENGAPKGDIPDPFTQRQGNQSHASSDS